MPLHVQLKSPPLSDTVVGLPELQRPAVFTAEVEAYVPPSAGPQRPFTVVTLLAEQLALLPA